jgi:hypothetical protein
VGVLQDGEGAKPFDEGIIIGGVLHRRGILAINCPADPMKGFSLSPK